MRDHVTPNEADTVMANIHPSNRRWGCRAIPGEVRSADFGCACPGCIYGALSWDEFCAWEERESNREPTQYIDYESCPIEFNLQERLALFKYRKHSQKAKP